MPHPDSSVFTSGQDHRQFWVEAHSGDVLKKAQNGLGFITIVVQQKLVLSTKLLISEFKLKMILIKTGPIY